MLKQCPGAILNKRNGVFVPDGVADALASDEALADIVPSLHLFCVDKSDNALPHCALIADQVSLRRAQNTRSSILSLPTPTARRRLRALLLSESVLSTDCATVPQKSSRRWCVATLASVLRRA